MSQAWNRLNKCISIHSLHTEGDSAFSYFIHTQFIFQSTPSTRRETPAAYAVTCEVRDFNPLPPHGGRPDMHGHCGADVDISIHSLHTEGDQKHLAAVKSLEISIHSLHTEGDFYTV